PAVSLSSCWAPPPLPLVPQVPGVRPPHSNLSVHSLPDALPICPLKVAAPPVTVVAVAFVSVAPAGPEAITAVTGTPAPPAGLPAPSRACGTARASNGAPLVAVAGGSVVIVSWVAVPAPSVLVAD